MRTILRSFILFAFSLTAFAGAFEDGMAEFYKVEGNLAKFEATEAQLAAQRKAMLGDCPSSQFDCNCVAQEFEKISDKAFFYESVLAYENYIARSEAMQEGNSEKAQQLKLDFDALNSPTKALEKACALNKQ